ncbi:hypothetical protein PRIPAC_76402 [Pristionchus pacificus]|uniref:G protein-coupled receptor n=1 Tax=Pristionchus pacificus TaxID=54126 RepID=A0A2A6B5D7_PRIPA|nr:hypothetical protein PRIPAC_76402 [Pristionchus pacificus]|eukprot:PDM61090.1 G protein-coupled receptor [Pristionchus pacificus]
MDDDVLPSTSSSSPLPLGVESGAPEALATEMEMYDTPFMQSIGMFTFLVYIAVFTIGIPANIYVLFRMRRLASSDNERYRNGTGIALCSMAAADLCSILLICAQNVHQMTYTGHNDPSASSFTANLMCKGMLFLTHTVTGISIWSWLLLSSLRYLAICHPLYHLRLWRMPYRALAFIIAMSALLNAWLLVVVESTPGGCQQSPLLRSTLAVNRLFHFVEACWSFCIPCVVIVVMDSSVVLKSTSFPRLRRKSPHKKSSALDEVIKLTRTSSDKLKMLQRRHQKALIKWLAVALVCILLNTPENLYRLIQIFGFGDSESAFNIACRMLTQVLYFSQFAFNAIYLAIFVYDKSCRGRATAAAETSVMNSHHYIARSRRPSNSEHPGSMREHFPASKSSTALSPVYHPLCHNNNNNNTNNSNGIVNNGTVGGSPTGSSPSVVISTKHPLSGLAAPSISRSVPRLALTLSTSSPTRTPSSLSNTSSNNLLTTGTFSLPTTPRGSSAGNGILKVFPREPKPVANPCDLPATVTTRFY